MYPLEIAIESIKTGSSSYDLPDLSLTPYIESKLTTQYESRINNYKEYTPFVDGWNIVLSFSVDIDPAYVQLMSTYVLNNGSVTASSYGLILWDTSYLSSYDLQNLIQYAYNNNLYWIDLEKHGPSHIKLVGDYVGDIRSIFYISFIKCSYLSS